jgi:hypothetical protein
MNVHDKERGNLMLKNAKKTIRQLLSDTRGDGNVGTISGAAGATIAVVFVGYAGDQLSKDQTAVHKGLGSTQTAVMKKVAGSAGGTAPDPGNTNGPFGGTA